MIPERIIEKAIEGGWRSPVKQVVFIEENETSLLCGTPPQTVIWNNAEIALDSLFWQALWTATGGKLTDECATDFSHVKGEEWMMPEWRYDALQFYDLILNGGDTDAYWQELLGVTK